MSAGFAPFEELFGQVAHALPDFEDGSHDVSHLERVWANARRIAKSEGGDLRLLAAAVMLHDCVAVEKNSPLRSQASRLAAEKAGDVLCGLGWSAAEIEIVVDAIRCHSYSAGLKPSTVEGRILQDADRLDAIGLVGVARCFYTAGRMGSKMYDENDPKANARELNDARFALDHFPKKLLRLSENFQTAAGALLARQRHEALLSFYREFLAEVSGS